MRTAELCQSLAGRHSVVVVEHDMDFVARIARKVTVLHEGSVLAEGSMDEVQADPRGDRGLSRALMARDDVTHRARPYRPALNQYYGGSHIAARRRRSRRRRGPCTAICSAATASARRRCSKCLIGLLPARSGTIRFDDSRRHAAAAVRARAAPASATCRRAARSFRGSPCDENLRLGLATRPARAPVSRATSSRCSRC